MAKEAILSDLADDNDALDLLENIAISIRKKWVI
jgi:hypothetical protein